MKPTNVLFFTPVQELEETIPPVPASEFWPEWFRKQQPKRDHDQHSWSTVKSCPGIMDILNMGYIIPLWCDYKVTKVRAPDMRGDINPETASSQPEQLMIITPQNLNQGGRPLFSAATHPHEQIDNYPFKENQWKGSLKFQMPWEIKTDPGYSCLITAPFYHRQHNLEVLTGSVDTDYYHEMHVNTFFESKVDEEILFERGTPLCQIIPYKREEYKMETAVGDYRTKINRLTQWIHNSMFAPQHYRKKLNQQRYK